MNYIYERVNPNVKVIPICIVVDKSKSMSSKDNTNKSRMDRLNEGINHFIEEIKKDDYLSDSVEISIVSFCDEAYVEQDFYNVDSMRKIRITTSNKVGDASKGVEKALELIQNKTTLLKKNRQSKRNPWIVIFSDGRATSTNESKYELQNRLENVQKALRDMERNNQINIIPVLISNPSLGNYQEALYEMRSYTDKDRASILGSDGNSLSFTNFFANLSRSVSSSNANLMFNERRNDNNIRNVPKYVDRPNTESVSILKKVDEVFSDNNSFNQRSSHLIIYNINPIDTNQRLRIEYSDLKNRSYNIAIKKDYYELANAKRLELSLDSQATDLIHVTVYLTDSYDNVIMTLYDNNVKLINNKASITLSDYKVINSNDHEETEDVSNINRESVSTVNNKVNNFTDDNNNDDDDEYYNDFLKEFNDFDDF